MAEETTTETPAADAPDAAAEAEEAEPVDEVQQALVDTLREALGDRVVEHHIVPGRRLWVRVERDAWFEAAEVAKQQLGCTFFDFLSALDWMPSPWGRYEDSAIDSGIASIEKPESVETGVTGGDTRFQLLCRLANVQRHHAVIFKADLPDDDLRARSLTPLFGGAEWHERECWEMFGIVFDGHPGLRHLYLPGHFEGHPLRKDFPLLARVVKPWPGIVDVEPLPRGDDDDEASPATAEAETEGESSSDDAEGGAT